MQNCYEFCFGIAKCIYNFFIFLSCRTPPLIEEAPKHTECYKNGVKYCEMCDLDDFVNPPSPPLEKVEPNFCTTFLKSGEVEPNFCTTFLKSGEVEPNFDFVFSPPFPPFYKPIFNKSQLQH
jgi:hypothetical protein